MKDKSTRIMLETTSIVIGALILITGFVFLFTSLELGNSRLTKQEQEKEAQIELYGYYDKNKEVLTEYKKVPIENNWQLIVSVPMIVLGGFIMTFNANKLDKE